MSVADLTSYLQVEKDDYFHPFSLIEMCEGSEQVMIYGWQNCGYSFVAQSLREECENEEFPLQRIFDHTVGDYLAAGEVCTTLEGRKFNHTHFESDESYQNRLGNHSEGVVAETPILKKSLQRECKAALTNVVIENYKRVAEELPLIPVIFFIDADGNTRPFRMDHMTSKESQYNDQYTYKELRRAYKLCTHENQKLREVAQATFRFAKLRNIEEGEWEAEPVPAPWANSQFASLWEQRKKISKSKPKESYLSNWREQLETHIQVHELHANFESQKKRKDAPFEKSESRPAKRARTSGDVAGIMEDE